jgi:putative membrane protein
MLATLPQYLLWFALCMLIWLISVVIYAAVTPIRELSLIKKGDTAASVSLGGTVIGLALPLAALSSSVQEVEELLLWGALSLICQIGVYFLAMLVLPQFKRGINENKLSYGVILAAFSVGVGILNAGVLNS